MNEPDRNESDKAARPDPVGEMHKRRIAMPDCRYMIFYTFGDERLNDASGNGEAAEVNTNV